EPEGGDLEYPCGNGAALGIEPVGVSPDGQEDLLYEVLGAGTIEARDGDREDESREPAVEEPECLGAPSRDLAHQLLVARGIPCRCHAPGSVGGSVHCGPPMMRGPPARAGLPLSPPVSTHTPGLEIRIGPGSGGRARLRCHAGEAAPQARVVREFGAQPTELDPSLRPAAERVEGVGREPAATESQVRLVRDRPEPSEDGEGYSGVVPIPEH